MAGSNKYKYKPEYRGMLLKHCSQGLSFAAFAAEIGVHRDTIYAWEKRYPQFAEAKKKGESLSLLFWEKLGVLGASGKVKNFNSTAFIFNMKNRFKWSDRTDLKIEDTRPDSERHELLRSIDKKKLIKLARQEKDAG